MTTLVRSRPLGFYMAGLALSLMLPSFAFTALLAHRWVEAEQTRLEATTQETNERAQE